MRVVSHVVEVYAPVLSVSAPYSNSAPHGTQAESGP